MASDGSWWKMTVDLSLPPAVDTELRIGGELHLAVLFRLKRQRTGPRNVICNPIPRKRDLLIVRWAGETRDSTGDLWYVRHIFPLCGDRGDGDGLESQLHAFYALGGSESVIWANIPSYRDILPGSLFVGIRSSSWQGVVGSGISVWIPGTADNVRVGVCGMAQEWRRANDR